MRFHHLLKLSKTCDSFGDDRVASVEQAKSDYTLSECVLEASDRVKGPADPGGFFDQALRSRSALPTTETELNDMAAAAMSGDSRIPKNG